MKWRDFWIFGLVLVVGFLPFEHLFAAMSSTNYNVRWDSLSTGGNELGSSTSYQLHDSAGGLNQGASTSDSYELQPGYRAGIFDPSVGFKLLLQDRASQVGVTAISSTAVTVTSTFGFAVNDYIAIVQNEGVSQKASIAKVDSISGSDLVFDWLTDGDGVLSIDGTSDYVYQLDATALNLGTLSPLVVSTVIAGWEASVDVPDGYSVYVSEDQDLEHSTFSGNIIDDVLDGAVSSGSEEYGAVSSDDSIASTTFDTQDTRITSLPAIVSDRSNVQLYGRDFLTFKASIDSSTGSGTYSQLLTFVYVGDF